MEKEVSTHSSILAWRIPSTEEPSGLQFMGPQRVRHEWIDLAHTHGGQGTVHSFSLKKKKKLAYQMWLGLARNEL